MNGLVVLLVLAPACYLALTWTHIPRMVPMHYNARLVPDRMEHKSQLWISTAGISAISVLVYLLLRYLRRIDPKWTLGASPESFGRLGLLIVVLQAALNFLIIFSASSHVHIMERLLLPLLGLAFALIGNYLYELKPNYFAGIRIPWTLRSEENWKATHLLAGRLWFWGGMMLALLTLFLPSLTGFVTLLVFTATLVFVPLLYSFRLYRKTKKAEHR